MSRLLLRPLQPADELVARRAHAEMAAEGFEFLIGWDGASTFPEYLDRLERQERGEGLERWQVPATFRVAEVDGTIVGRIHLRHRLNGRLCQEGGHVGFSVLEAHRRRGFGTRMLQLACEKLTALDVDRALVTCADDNQASRRVIEACGGRLSDLVPRHGGGSTRRYWIELQD